MTPCWALDGHWRWSAPAIFTIVDGRPNIHIDGTQGWRNSRLIA